MRACPRKAGFVPGTTPITFLTCCGSPFSPVTVKRWE
jgi:hypothetical protein